jgi:hypothetical protein
MTKPAARNESRVASAVSARSAELLMTLPVNGWMIRGVGRVCDPDVSSNPPQGQKDVHRRIIFENEVSDVGHWPDVEWCRSPDLCVGQHQCHMRADIEQAAFEVDIRHVEAGNAIVD